MYYILLQHANITEIYDIVCLKSYALKFLYSFQAFQIKSYDLLNESDVAPQARTSVSLVLFVEDLYVHE